MEVESARETRITFGTLVTAKFPTAGRRSFFPPRLTSRRLSPRSQLQLLSTRALPCGRLLPCGQLLPCGRMMPRYRLSCLPLPGKTNQLLAIAHRPETTGLIISLHIHIAVTTTTANNITHGQGWSAWQQQMWWRQT